MYRRAVIVALYLVGNSLVCGCGYSRPTRVEATGRVTLGGKPLDGASVTLVPVHGGRPSFAVTADDGTFSLGTFGATDGVIPGRYRVAVVKQVLRAAADKQLEKAAVEEPTGDEETVASVSFAEADYENLVPGKYADPQQSGLEIEVGSGTDRIEIAIP
jgi:hypothetical protein